VDVDAYVAAHHAEWNRLEWLINRGRRLTGPEIDELVDLYQRTATHLSVVRSSTPDPILVGRLSSLVARSRATVTGAQAPLWRNVTRFVTVHFPAAAYRLRWWWLGNAAFSVTIGTIVALWVSHNPKVQATIATPYEARQYVNHDFSNYYTDHHAAAFGFQVWVNNVWVSALALIFGLLLCVGPLYAQYVTSVGQLGGMGGLMLAHGKGELFLGLILPHGLVELSSVYLACAAGMKIGWTIIDPGPRPRGQALAEEGRSLVSIALGLIGSLGLAACIEGFVTGYVSIVWLRIGIGVVALTALLAYIIIFGRRALRLGATGDAETTPDLAPVAG
jgi:uncharacterized membrane protein SpoIIM required for sporulation